MINNLPIIGIKKESISGVKEVLTSADFIFPINDSIQVTPNIENYLQNIQSGSYSKFKSISGRRSAALTFSVFFNYSTALMPWWVYLFQFCGWQTISVDKQDWVAVLESNDNVIVENATNQDIHVLKTLSSLSVKSNIITASATIEVVYPNETFDKQLIYTITGCMGTVKISGNAGEPIKIDFTFIGSLDSIDTVTELRLSNITDIAPTALLSSTMTIDSVSVSVQHFEITIGNVQNLFSNIMRHTGYDGCRISNTYITGLLDSNEPASSIVDKYTSQITNETSVMSLVAGGLFINCSNLQYTEVDPYRLLFDVNDSVSIGVNT